MSLLQSIQTGNRALILIRYSEFNRYMTENVIHIFSRKEVLHGSSHPTVYGSIDTPQSSILMYPFISHQITVFSPVTIRRQPQLFIHCLSYCLSFFAIWLRVFSQN